MPVTVDNRHNAGAVAGASTVNWNATVSAGLTNSILVVPLTTSQIGGVQQTPNSVQWDAGGTPVSMSELGSGANGDVSSAEIWYLKAPSSGTKQIQINNPFAIDTEAGSASYSLVDQTTPWNAASPQTTTGSVSGGAISLSVTSATNEMVIAQAFAENPSGNLSVSGSQTVIGSGNTGNPGVAGAGADLAGASSVSMGWSGAPNGQEFGIIGASLRFNPGNTTITPNVGQLTLTGFAPTITGITQTVTPNVGQLSLTGFAPTLTIGGLVNPRTGQLGLAGFPPTLIIASPVGMAYAALQPPAAAALSLVPRPPALNPTVTPAKLDTSGGGGAVGTPASPPAVKPPSLRFNLPNAPKNYDQKDQDQLRKAIISVGEKFSQQLAAPDNVILVQITQLPPSPASDAGVNVQFQVHAIDPLGQTCQVAIVALQGNGVSIVSGPALAVFSPDKTIWKVALPAPGTGSPQPGAGSVICRGQTPDGRHTDVSLPLPEQTIIAQPAATISFDPIPGNTAKQASVSFTMSVPQGANSIKYLESRSSQPTVASVLVSGTVVSSPTDGNNFTQTNIDTATLGDTAYVTIVPFTGTAATGNQLPVIELKATFSVWGKQKTAFYQRTAWIDASPLGPGSTGIGHTTDSNDTIINAALSSLVIRDTFRINTVIPIGALLVTASLTCFWNNATNQLGTFEFLVDANGTNVNFGNATHPANPQTVTVGLSNTAVSSGFVVLRVQWAPPVSANADAGQAGLEDVNITYIAPTQDVTP